MPICKGSTCKAEIVFIPLTDANGSTRTIPVDCVNGTIRQRVTLPDGRTVLGIVLHHSTCPDVKEFKKKA